MSEQILNFASISIKLPIFKIYSFFEFFHLKKILTSELNYEIAYANWKTNYSMMLEPSASHYALWDGWVCSVWMCSRLTAHTYCRNYIRAFLAKKKSRYFAFEMHYIHNLTYLWFMDSALLCKSCKSRCMITLPLSFCGRLYFSEL